MDTFWWILSIALMLVGLAGCALPLLPGTTLIFAAALIHRLTLGDGPGAGWWTIVFLGLLMLASHALDFLSAAAGAKWFGATRWGAVGGLVGTVVGLFFGLPGLILGPLIGVLAGELLGGKEWLPAGKSGLGTLVGTGLGIVFRIVIGVAMVVWWTVALWAGW